MQYLGGKKEISGWVAEQIIALKGHRAQYIEPFVGSAAILEKVASHFKECFAGDINQDLIDLWLCIQQGWVPPSYVSKELWQELKNDPQPSALRAFAGFCCSYRGKWFSGYDPIRVSKSYLHDPAVYGRNSLLRTAPLIADVTFRCCDYGSWLPNSNSLVYCDPPYAKTTQYANVPKFDTDRFFGVASKWVANGALVIISEQDVYPGWEILAKRTRKSKIKKTEKSQSLRDEYLLIKYPRNEGE